MLADFWRSFAAALFVYSDHEWTSSDAASAHADHWPDSYRGVHVTQSPKGGTFITEVLPEGACYRPFIAAGMDVSQGLRFKLVNGRDVTRNKAAVVDALARIPTAAKLIFSLDPIGGSPLGITPVSGPLPPTPPNHCEPEPEPEAPANEASEEVLQEAWLLVKRGRLDWGMVITSALRGNTHAGSYLTGATEVGAAAGPLKRSEIEIEDGLRFKSINGKDVTASKAAVVDALASIQGVAKILFVKDARGYVDAAKAAKAAALEAMKVGDRHRVAQDALSSRPKISLPAAAVSPPPSPGDGNGVASGDIGLGAATAHSPRKITSADQIPRRAPTQSKIDAMHTNLSPTREIRKTQSITISLRKPLGITLLTHGRHCYVATVSDGGSAAAEFGRHGVGPDSGLRFKKINGTDVHISEHDVTSALKAGGRTGTAKIIFTLDPVGYRQARLAKE